ncbi:MAG: type I DNA topoisomerase [Ignavibacteriae bacterium]|nr:type I DNA topoisomerase [Ignavibacteriota bacterium]NOG97800.1 type I DNA topoisomerase [Ignavibacteriota bacterium]
MIKNLVIVESPAKAKTIEGFLGKDFLVKSSYGHVRDLEKKNKGIDIENNFTPLYKVADDKKDVVKELKKFSKDSETVWLATDEDREGEAISWHLKEVLKLKDEKIKRIVFHEITKKAITNAIANPRGVNQNLVDAQQARRILDRLVGFELSPVLWRKVKPSLSAGRVQSVAVRLIVEREREIDNFKPESKFRVIGNFLVDNGNGEEVNLSAELSKRFETEKEAEQFIKDCTKANFKIGSLEKKPVKKSPAPPFTTSTLQQEASRKLGYSVAKTMLVAQKLYEAGNITYMRTDSVNLSDTAIAEAKTQIENEYGKKYSQSRKYKTKSASAQEAHEAIRPSYFEKETIKGGNDEQRLYQLIWKRAIASQMSDAQIERTIAKIDISNRDEKFTAQGEVIKFDGFLKVYIESTDDENGENGTGGILPPIKENQTLNLNGLTATERFSRAAARFTEASLVKKLEELGIGRPSTYAPTISTVQRRGYVVKEDRPGVERKYIKIELDEKNNIKREELTEIAGAERNKLFPEDIGILVNDFLIENFPKIMDYKFTANVEKELDDIASGELNYHEMLKDFYFPFHETVEHTIENSERVSGERVLGIDPKTKKQVLVRMARFGPVAQINDPDDENDKPEYAGLRPGQKLESITLEEALELFKLPRTLGDYEDKTVVAAIGRFGPYVRHDSKFVSLGKEYDPHTVTLEEAIELIEEKRKKDAEKHIKSFDEDPEMQILNGRWGPYIKAGKKNVRIPKDVEASKLSYEECVKLVEKAPEKKGRKAAKKTTKKK